jgi:hypothetical protein
LKGLFGEALCPNGNSRVAKKVDNVGAFDSPSLFSLCEPFTDLPELAYNFPK